MRIFVLPLLSMNCIAVSQLHLRQFYCREYARQGSSTPQSHQNHRRFYEWCFRLCLLSTGEVSNTILVICKTSLNEPNTSRILALPLVTNLAWSIMRPLWASGWRWVGWCDMVGRLEGRLKLQEEPKTWVEHGIQTHQTGFDDVAVKKLMHASRSK